MGDSLPKTARAAVFTGPEAAISIRGMPLREPVGAEVLVRVTCCTLCGSDLSSRSGKRSSPVPGILGHEILGTIAAFGPDAPRFDLRNNGLLVGDRVTWTVAASCGACGPCGDGLPQKCRTLFKYGHEPLDPARGPDGGLAEYCLLAPETGIVKPSDKLPDFVACPANCATSTVCGAFRLLEGLKLRRVLIQGAGMLGLTACAMARECGAEVVACTDISADRLAMARRFGATHACLPSEPSLGGEFDAALELSGSPDAAEQALPLLRIGGRAIWVGAVSPTRAAAVFPEMVVRRLLTIQGLHNYIPADLAAAVTFLESAWRMYPFAELVGESFPLAEADAAFRAAGRHVRVAVRD